MSAEQAKTQNALAMKDTVDIVAKRVRQFQESGQLHLPANYSAENAMKSAWLTLQSTLDKSGKPALQVCTKDSVANALLDMIVQGLNPAKKQCYFIVYGNKLICQRSYFGSMHLVKEVAGAKDVYAQVVYRGDDFQYEISKGRKKVLKHVQKIENIKNENIIAAYCIIEFEDGRPDYAEIMTIDQIKQAWKQSPMYKDGGNGTHQKFTEEMAKKTVINRACKSFINSSSDSNLFLSAFNRADEEKAEVEVAQEIAENANAEYIDIQTEDVTEHESEYKEQTERTDEAGEPVSKEQPPYPADGEYAPTGTDGPGF